MRIRSSKLWLLFAVLALIAAACGSDGTEESTGGAASLPPVPQVTSTSAAVAPDSSATVAVPETSATTAALVDYSVTLYGSDAIGALPGSDGQLGSGCTPGAGPLPDGVWFGWVTATAPDALSFDLACLSPGDVPIASNTNPSLRSVTVDTSTMVYLEGGSTLPYDAWPLAQDPVWLFINDATVSEIAELTTDIELTAPPPAWAEVDVSLPVGGGCCGSNYTGSASPDDPFAGDGLPQDGAYLATVESAGDDLMLEIYALILCEDRPDLCVPDYAPGDLGADWTVPTVREIPIDANLTVRIIPVDPSLGALGSSVGGLEANGVAFGMLLDEMQAAWDEYVAPELAVGADRLELRDQLLARGADDPSFPYGPADTGSDMGDILAYRGPLGVDLLFEIGESAHPFFLWPTQLEVEDGAPIVTIDGGRLAG